VRLSVSNRTENLVAVGSRSHSSPEEERVLGLFGVADIVSKGSSLKFCLVAEGIADVYYRHNPTMEWDTAAGQAIVEASGGVVLNKDGVRFYYNKEELRNGSFMCLGAKSTSVAWM
jgi:3'(2'), 5'-bisphosphate nucleotidase